MLRHRRTDIISIYGVLYTLQKPNEALKIYLTLLVTEFEIRAGVAQSV
jgi:hypothetical protein